MVNKNSICYGIYLIIVSTHYQRIRGYFYNEMRYRNLHFACLLTYLSDNVCVTRS